MNFLLPSKKLLSISQCLKRPSTKRDPKQMSMDGNSTKGVVIPQSVPRFGLISSHLIISIVAIQSRTRYCTTNTISLCLQADFPRSYHTTHYSARLNLRSDLDLHLLVYFPAISSVTISFDERTYFASLILVKSIFLGMWLCILGQDSAVQA